MNFFCSTIGRKILMAVTGLILIGFVIGHLVGNLQIFSVPDHINGYAHFLQGLGPLLWAFRLGMLALIGIHVWAATTLTLENHAARDVGYTVKHTIRATLASRTMRWTGYVVLAFLVYHIAQFTIGIGGHCTLTQSFKGNLPGVVLGHDVREFGIPLASAGTEVHDVYSMVFLGFANPIVSVFYIFAVGLLAFHLVHGADSLFQTFGLRSGRWSGALRKLCVLFGLVYFLGNLAIPGAILTGLNKPAEGTLAYKVLVEGKSIGQAAAQAPATSKSH